MHGTSFPLGATLGPDGVNFSVFSKHAAGMQLLFFDRVDAETPTRVIELRRCGTRHMPRSRAPWCF